MAQQDIRVGTRDRPNPYGVTNSDSDRVNSSLTFGDALPLINLIMSMTDRRFRPVFEHLSERIARLEREVDRLASISHQHPVVHALPQPSLPGRRSVLDGEEPPEGENTDSWASQEEDNKDIKF